jgi:hypothetical protein
VKDEAKRIRARRARAARKYRPDQIKTLLVAEAPPASPERYFYFEDVPTQDSLFRNVAKVLLGETPPRAAKKRALTQLRERGVFLIDLSLDPVAAETDLAALVPALVRRIKRVRPDRVILIKATVYDAAFDPLREAGLPVVDERIPFPASGQQARFAESFARALRDDDYVNQPRLARLPLMPQLPQPPKVPLPRVPQVQLPKLPQMKVPRFDTNAQAWNEQLRRIEALSSRNLFAINDQIARVLRASSGAADLQRAVAQAQHAWIEPIRKAGEALQLALREALPTNWNEATLDEIVDLAGVGTVAVVWVPRAEIVTKLVAASSHEEREQILIERRTEILEDVARVLEEASLSGSATQVAARDLAIEATRAAQAEFDRVSQTGFAAALSLILHDVLGFARLGNVFKAWKDKEIEDAVMSELRIVALELATANALLDTKDAKPGFNRHGTQHGSPAFFSVTALIAAALLVTGWVRELAWLAEHRPDMWKETKEPAS